MSGGFDLGAYMTNKEFAAKLGVSTGAVRQWVYLGKLQPRHIGPTLIFTEADLHVGQALLARESRARHSQRMWQTGTQPASEYVTIEQAATILHCTPRTIARRIASRRLTAYRTDLSPTSLLRSDVEALAAEGEIGRQGIAA